MDCSIGDLGSSSSHLNRLHHLRHLLLELLPMVHYREGAAFLRQHPRHLVLFGAAAFGEVRADVA